MTTFQPKVTGQNQLHELGYKIFLDRYAQKDMTRATLAVGDIVIVVVDSKTGQREVGKITAIQSSTIAIELLDGTTVTRDFEHVDKPLETRPEQMMDRVAGGIASAEITPDLQQTWSEKFRWLLDDWKFVPGGRILTGAGTGQELTFYNCYVIPSPVDSREGIIETLRQMTEIMSRGGGVGINISTLRPRHAYVKGVNGRSSGSVSWGALYSFVTGLIEQGGSRRGALMLILNDYHPDVFDFINSKRKAGNITNANISVNVSDKLMKAIEADADWDLVFPDTGDPDYNTVWKGDLDAWIASGRKVNHYKTIKARSLWNAIIESAWASAEPGIWFGERANKMSNSHFYPQGKLIATNPCVTGETRIYTNRGLIKAVDLFNDETEIEVAIDGRFGLDPHTTPSTRVFMTGHKPIYKLQTKEGYSIRATADHRFMTPRGWVELGDLQAGDKVHILNRKGGFGQEGSLELGRVLGWLVGDGTIKTECAVLSFFGEEKQELAPMFAQYVETFVEPLTVGVRDYSVDVVNIQGRDEARVQSTRLRTMVAEYGLTENKFQVPEVIFQGTEDMQRGFLQALFTADGRVMQSKGATVVRLASSHLDLLYKVQLLLGNFGIASRIYKNRRDAQQKYMPDGKGGQKLYNVKPQHELQIGRSNVVIFGEEIGFLLRRQNQSLTDQLADYKVGVRSEVFMAVVESVEYDGDEDVYDLTEPITHSFTGNNFIVHNCGEQSLSAFAVCNLGALNLARFVDSDTGKVVWEELRQAVHYAVRFLDNVIDGTPYFFTENEAQQKLERRVGLGIMGLAEMLIRCGVRYGSEESIGFLNKLFEFITVEAYLASSAIAAEKGSFPAFNAEKFLESGFMRQMPEHVRQAIKKNGVRNVTLLTIAPTGCVVPDTMISTDRGLINIEALGNTAGEQWQDLDLGVMTDQGVQNATRFFVNGLRQTIKIITHRGYAIEATPNHQLRVINAKGDYVWRRMDEIEHQDTVVLWRDTLLENDRVSLKTGFNETHHNSKVMQLPQQMTPELAELIGLYMGDGYTKVTAGLNIVVNNHDQDLIAHVQDLALQVFGVIPTIEARIGCQVVHIHGRSIVRFMKANGFSKEVGNKGEGAESAFIPSAILQSGRTCVAAFLRGLFESDGTAHRQVVEVSTVSPVLAKQVQVALLGLGIVSHLRTVVHAEGERFGQRPIYRVRLLNRDEVVKFKQEIGFISERKQSVIAQIEPSSRGDTFAVEAAIHDFYAASQGINWVTRQEILGRVSNGSLNIPYVKQMSAEHPQLQSSILGDLALRGAFFDVVDHIEYGMSPTFDISVPHNHTYVANGFVSHNTTGTMVNTSTGIEPFFSWVYYRKSRLGLHEEQVPLVKDWYAKNPTTKQLPDFFVTAMDLTPEEHVRVQATIQRWIDSSISKTANLPNNYTIEQVSDLYKYMYELGCKGGTVYRDGSRDEQVLMLKGDERAESEMENVKGRKEKKSETDEKPAQVATPHRVYPRPKKLTGVTVNCATPFGTAYVTMNTDEHGYPFEVFITAPGKAGSDLQADAEGLGRMISLSLRTTEPHNRKTMLQLIIDQLRDIGGARSVGFGQNRVVSLPDAVARVLEENYFPKDEPQQLGLPIPEITVLTVKSPSEHENSNGNGHHGVLNGADVCPSCANITLVRAEGCRKCLTCGYSEC